MRKTFKSSLETLAGLDGYIRSCVVEGEGALLLATHGEPFPGDTRAETAAQVALLEAQRRALEALQRESSTAAGELDETVLTLGRHYYLLRPSRKRASVFISLVLDRERANLGRARLTLSAAEKNLGL